MALTAKQRSALEMGRKLARVKSRANAPHARKQPTRSYGVLADRAYSAGPICRRGIVHFS